MNPENIKLCKICNINECKINQKRCQKCMSRINNELLKQRNYYKIYYEDNKEHFKEIAKENYKKLKLLNVIKNKVGRPKKIKHVENIVIQ